MDAVDFVDEALKGELRAHGRDEVDLAVNEDERVKLWRHQRRLDELLCQVDELARDKLVWGRGREVRGYLILVERWKGVPATGVPHKGTQERHPRVAARSPKRRAGDTKGTRCFVRQRTRRRHTHLGGAAFAGNAGHEAVALWSP